MTGKNILVVHNCENLSSARRSTLDFIQCFERYAPENEYLYHRIQHPVTPIIRSMDWDAVIFESTALGVVTIRPKERFQRLRESWNFLRTSRAVKIVFPQDDASHGWMLDYWFHWMGVDAVFTVRPEKKDLIYPLTTRRADFISTVAGFIDDASADRLSALGRPFHERAIVFGQRFTLYPAWGGRFARRKGDAALRIRDECERRGIRHDISADRADVFLGDDWYRFLGQCRFVVGAEGGHSIWDPYGAIQDAVTDYTTRFPNASFEEIEDAHFYGLDGLELFPGFPPRILESALLGCGQVLMEGRYRDFIKPGVHYIPVKEDFSNLNDVFSAIENAERMQSMIAVARRDLVETKTFRFSRLVSEVMEYIDRHLRPGDIPRPTAPVARAALLERYFWELHAAIMSVGVEQEKLYEPYLTDWVRQQISGQITDQRIRAQFVIDGVEHSVGRKTEAKESLARPGTASLIRDAWMPDGKSRSYRMCTTCVMDTTDPEITFDEEGRCSYCTGFDEKIRPFWKPTPEGRQELETILANIREYGRGKPYDCIIGLSGGVDSSYVAVKVVEWGLRPLVVHVDAGWNSELAVRNIEQIVTRLGLDLITHVVDWEDMKELQLAFLRSNLANQDIPQDHAFFAALYSYAVKSNIRYVISGTNLATESILPQAWGYDAMDARHLKAVHRRFGTKPLKKFPIISFFQYYFYFPRIRQMRVVAPLDYIPYNKEEAIDFLERNFGWRYYGGKHYESRWTRFYQAHYLPAKFGYDKRKAHLSSLVVAGQMTREVALRELENPLYRDNELAEDTAFVAKKLGLSVDELEDFIRQPPRYYDEFPTNRMQLKVGLKALALINIGLAFGKRLIGKSN